MPVAVECSCGKQLRAPDQSAGRRVKCPSCGEAVQVPAASAGPPRVKETPPPADDGLLRFDCTGCGKPMQSKAEFAGKKTRCPNCQALVKIGEGAPPPAVVPPGPPAKKKSEATITQKAAAASRRPVVEDEDEDDEDEEELESKSKRRRLGAKNKKAKGTPLWVRLAVYGSLLFFLAVGVVGYLILKAVYAKAKDVDVIPADSATIVSVHVAELWKNPNFKQILQTVPILGQRSGEIQREVPILHELKYEEIQRAVFVTQADGKHFGTIQTEQPLAENVITSALKLHNGKEPTKKEAAGKTYYVPTVLPPGALGMPQFQGGSSLAHALFNDQLVIFGDESEIIKILERGTNVNKQGPMADAIKRITGPDLLIMAGTPMPGRMKELADLIKMQADLPIDRLADVNRLLFVANVDQNIAFELICTLPDAAKAAEFKKGLDDAKKPLEAAIGIQGLMLPPDTRKAMNDALKKLEFSASDKEVKIKFSAETKEILDGLKSLVPPPPRLP